MFIRIEPDGDTPLFAQIKKSVTAGIADGELKPGDALPSVRRLASDLGVNLHTVNKAYQALESEGYVKILGSRGTVVTAPPKGENRKLDGALRDAFIELKARGASETEARERAGVIIREVWQ